MPLGLVAEVVANGGVLPQLAELGKKKKVFTKKNGVVFGVFLFIFLSMFCTSFFAILGAPDELVAICAVSGFFSALMAIIGSLIFLPSSKPKYFSQYAGQQPVLHGQNQQALPPQQSLPANFYDAPRPAASWRDTNDLQPGSVTEGTTKLLEKDDSY